MTTSSNANRRTFLKTAAAAGAGSMLAGAAPAQAAQAVQSLEKRPLGKTGIEVPILSLGGMFDTEANQLLLRQAYNWGVRYWDTAKSYGNGGSETGMGKYFSRNPEHRKDIFLVSKASGARSVADVEKFFNASLERLQTDYIDLYFIHSQSSTRLLTDELKAWAEQKKKQGKIKLFGFTSHKNYTELLEQAPKYGWIDSVMTVYNYHNLTDPKFLRAVEGCHKAGTGLTAMKTMGHRVKAVENKKEQELLDVFEKKGFSVEQAKMKAIWQSDPQVAAICSQMPTMALLTTNLAAAMDSTKLSRDDLRTLQAAAQIESDSYCAGCGHICEYAVAGQPPIADAMRLVMYHQGYTDPFAEREWLAAHPEPVFRKLDRFDYTEAERRCPRHLPIAQLMKQATQLLT